MWPCPFRLLRLIHGRRLMASLQVRRLQLKTRRLAVRGNGLRRRQVPFRLRAKASTARRNRSMIPGPRSMAIRGIPRRGNLLRLLRL